MLEAQVSGEKRAGVPRAAAGLYAEILETVGTVRGKNSSVEDLVSQGGCDGV